MSDVADVAVLILLAEDEPLIRLMLQEELEEAGFKLVVAADGQKAMVEIEADAVHFRGLVTDIRLGQGPSGWELARRARELNPEIAVVYVSGDSAHEWHAQGVPKSIMVPKPFVPAQIITAVTTLLNNADGH